MSIEQANAHPGFRVRERIELDHGPLIIELPMQMTESDVAEISDLFALLLTKWRRRQQAYWPETPSHDRITTPAYTVAPHASGAKADDND